MSDKKVNSLNRAVQAAAELFLQRRFEDVSIKEIAAISHCSADTIYAVFGNKENLFVNAVAYQNEHSSMPKIHYSDGPKSLTPLLSFAAARIRFLANPRTRAAFRAIIARAAKTDVFHRHIEQRQQQICDVVAEVKDCVAAKLLLAHDPNVIAYNIFSGVAYEPLTVGQIYGNSAPVYISDIIQNVFTPLVSRKGKTQLLEFLRTVEEDIEATSKERAYYLWQHFN